MKPDLENNCKTYLYYAQTDLSNLFSYRKEGVSSFQNKNVWVKAPGVFLVQEEQREQT